MAFCRFHVGTGEPKVELWHTVTAWAQLARQCKDRIRKGDWVTVLGYISRRYFEKDGEKRQAIEVTAWQVDFLGR